MDQAPKLPPRPEKTNTTTMTPLQRHQAMVAQMKASRKMNIGGGGGGVGADQAELLTVVPPPPAPSADAVATVATPPNAGHMFSFAVPSSSTSTSRTRSQHLGVVASTSLPSSSSSASSASPSPTLNPVPLSPSRVPSSVFNSFQENVLYSMEPSISEQISTNGSTTQPNILSPPTSSSSSSSSSSAKRPTRITPSNSLPGSALIDLNSLNNNNSSVNDEESARREKARQMIKSMVSAQQQQQLVVSPMFAPATSPLSVVPINVPSMSSAYPQTATLPLGINLVANPLYSNQLAAGSPTKLTAAFTNNSAAAAAAIYANLINNNNSHMINTTTTYPIPINHHHQLHHLHHHHHHPHQNIAINHLYFNTQLQQQQQQQQAYSNWAMIHQQQQQQPSASSFASSTSAASASSPLYSSIYTNFQDPIYMNEIFSKIQNNSNNSSASASVQGSPARGVAVDPNSSSPPHLKSVLTPTSVFDIRKYTTSQSVIDLFDPLAEVESTTDGQTPSPEYARAARTSSPIPPPPAEKSDAIKNRCLGEAVVPAISVEEDSSEEDEHSVAKKEDEVNNNNNSRSDRGEAVDGSTSPTTTSSSKRHSYTNVNDEPINLLYVEERSAKYSPEMQEFCDHLRALYLTVGSAKSTNGTSSSPEAPNSGLVWSPRIDMSRAGDKDGGGNSFSLDMYMCSPATKRQLAALNNCTSLNSSLSSSVSYSDESEQSERSAIFDVKFNALVYAKLTGEKAPDFSSSLGQQQQPSWHSKKLTCALDNVVDIIIYNLATFYGGDGKSEVNYEDFLLKVSGRNEYLVPRSQLASYVYIQQCKKMGQDVTLELVDQTATEFWRPYLRTEADTEYITSARFTPDELLPREAVAAFAGTASAHALNGVLEKLNLSMAKFLSLSTIDAVRAREGVAVFRELTAQIQALTSILSHVFTTHLYRAIDALLRYHRRHIADYGSGSGGVVSSQELMATFTSLAQEVLKAAAEVIHLFSVTFPVNWALPFKHAPRLPAKKEDITRQVESFKLRLDAVCQVAPEWKPAYGWFCLRVVIAHGFSVLEYKYTERKVVDMEHWRLEFDRELVFDTIIANLPREARVDFQLLGIKGNSSVGGSSGTVGAGSKLEVDILAATFFYLFEHENVDERHLFRIGAHLLPLTPFKPPLSIFKSSQSSLSSSNPNQSSAAAIYSFEQLDAHVPVIDDSNYVVGYHLAPKAPMIVFSIRQNKPAVQYYYPKVGGGSGGNQNSQRTSQLETSSSTFARSTFDRASLRLDTRVPLTLDRSDSVVSNGSSQGSIGGGGGGLHDQLYGFYGRSTECLEAAERAKIISVIQANPLLPLAEADRALLLKNAEALARFPGAILKLLKAPRWAHGDVRRTYQLLDSFDYFAIHNSSVVTSPQITTGSSAVSPLKMSRSMSFDAAGNASQSSSKQLPFLTAIEALQLLAADYPDRNVRLKAVRWLKHVSPDELCDFLPQLVQSLRYEPYLDCSLIWLLYECALSSSRFCHHLYWLLKSCREGDGRFGGRAAFYLNGLLALCGRRARAMFERQEQLGGRLEAISEEVKAAKDSAKAAVLRQRLETVHEFLECCPISIPLSPSLQVSGLELPQCSYFSSFSRPLKIVLHAAPPYCTSAAQLADAVGPTRPNLMAALYGQRKQLSKIIFKAGDDLRQDMLVMQIVSIINRLWLRAGLDLRLITFAVVNTAHRTGMIEMVSRARTLCQIQREYGVAGNFKRHTISQWLKRHNSGEFEYQMACENFVHSCAGYVVISYLLGFGDRHNDNIMVTTSGHLFHIDFGKFLGKAQTMAGFKRDRAPFVFTADMAYVINGESDRSGKSFQYFVDLCCTCFSQVRANGNFLLSLLAMMIPSSIEGLTPETIMYFHHALMPAETDSKAKEGFYRLIRESLDSFGTQFNFFIHSLAQMKLSGTGGGGGGSSAAQVESQNYVVIPGGGNTVENGSNENGDVSDGNGGGGGKSNGDNMMDSGMASLESSEHSVWRFSFSSTRFSRSQGTEGEITRLEIVSIWKRPPAIDEALGRDYLYKVLVSRATVPESLVYRSYREFGELHERLTRVFPLVRFETAGRGRRPTSATAAEGAKRELQTFLNRLLSLAHEISHSDIVYTFFHAYHRDQQYLDLDRGGLGGGLSVSDFGASASTVSLSSSSASALPPRSSGPLLPGKIKLAISYSSDGRLNVLVMYARNLVADRNSSPDTYVKLYLLPDPEKRTKRKTKVASKNANPTFMESISYPEMELKELRARKLEVSVWAYDISGNSRIGATMVDLATLDLESKTERWYKLFSAGAAAMQM